MHPLDYNTLTRRPDPHRSESWRVYCGDICAGWIAKTTTVGAATEWTWSAGFYPGSNPGEIKTGTAGSFDEARASFMLAWLKFAHSRTPADFTEWRDRRDLTAWKYRMLDHGLPLPTQSESGRARCFCGGEITTASVMTHIQTAHRGSEKE